MSARINIQRLSSMNSFIFRMKIFLDGQLLYKIADGEIASGDFSAGEHEIRFKLNIASTSARIMLQDGHEYNYTVTMHPLLPSIEFKPIHF